MNFQYFYSRALHNPNWCLNSNFLGWCLDYFTASWLKQLHMLSITCIVSEQQLQLSIFKKSLWRDFPGNNLKMNVNFLLDVSKDLDASFAFLN